MRIPFRRFRSFRKTGLLLVAALLCAASLTTVLAAAGSFGKPAAPMGFQTPGVLSLTLSPSTIAGGSGGSSTGTVTLNGPAPAGGAVVTLASSNIELAATLPSIRVPAGASSATFTVATNANYRAYSGLAFSAVISASHLGSTRSATLQVTAQPRASGFYERLTGGRQHAVERVDVRRHRAHRWEAGHSLPMFSGQRHRVRHLHLSAGMQPRLPASAAERWHVQRFLRHQRSESVAISRNYIVSGDRVPASIVAEAPAGQAQDREQGVPSVIDPNFNATYFPHAGGIGFPTGATSVSFDVATSYVPAINSSTSSDSGSTPPSLRS